MTAGFYRLEEKACPLWFVAVSLFDFNRVKTNTPPGLPREIPFFLPAASKEIACLKNIIYGGWIEVVLESD
jgi:hypothetical protein